MIAQPSKFYLTPLSSRKLARSVGSRWQALSTGVLAADTSTHFESTSVLHRGAAAASLLDQSVLQGQCFKVASSQRQSPAGACSWRQVLFIRVPAAETSSYFEFIYELHCGSTAKANTCRFLFAEASTVHPSASQRRARTLSPPLFCTVEQPPQACSISRSFMAVFVGGERCCMYLKVTRVLILQ